MKFAESIVKKAYLAWLESLVYVMLHGLNIKREELKAECCDPCYLYMITKQLFPESSVNPHFEKVRISG